METGVFNKPATFCSSDTVLEDRIFSVNLGIFLHDVVLKNITFSTGVLTVEECNARGFIVREYTSPNGRKRFSVEVPFDADVVIKRVCDWDAKFPFIQICLHFVSFWCRTLNPWLHSTFSLWSLDLSSCLKKLHLTTQLICRHLCRMLVR